MMPSYYVYIVTNKPYGTLYVGVTSDLIKRVYEHQNDLVKGFTSKYALRHLVYFEETDYVHAALQRERNMKHWLRRWKIDLINKHNPEWRDLSPDIGLVMDARVKPEHDTV
jgi:putative endonuclease